MLRTRSGQGKSGYGFIVIERRHFIKHLNFLSVNHFFQKPFFFVTVQSYYIPEKMFGMSVSAAR